jgi:hypothetical protein
MTPVPFELPVKASDAAALADLLYQTLEPRRASLSTPGVPADLRQRFTGRLSALELPTIRVYPGSLQADPIHPSAYFIAVDGARSGHLSPLLLRIAPAASPATGLFPKSILIGRMRPAGGREIVVNAIPFAPTDLPAITTFTGQVDRAFLPRPQGLQPALVVSSPDPATVFPAVFDAFRALGRDSVALEGDWGVILWSAIRSGWRDGYAAGTQVEVKDLDEARAILETRPGFTRYALDFSYYAGDAAAAAESLYDHIRRVKLSLPAGVPRGFDLEVPAGISDALRPQGRIPLIGPTGRVVIEPGDDAASAVASALRQLSGRQTPGTASAPRVP